MSGPGSGGNVIAALCSFFVPGLGQLLQGRLFTAAIHFLLGIILWFVWLGILMHIWSAYSAAVFVPHA
jgi:TM2 domain-containing membrane protein YozV